MQFLSARTIAKYGVIIKYLVFINAGPDLAAYGADVPFPQTY